MAWITTASGLKFYPLDPDPDSICIEDIAHALSHLCRFVGHCSEFYSVAQHSVHVSEQCDPGDALWGLLHDAAEAYLGDMSKLVKEQMLEYKSAEANLLTVIVNRFGLPCTEPSSVQRADLLLLVTEARDLFRGPTGIECPMLADRIEPWTPSAAKALFLRRFNELNGG